jgi:hypothetical protein
LPKMSYREPTNDAPHQRKDLPYLFCFCFAHPWSPQLGFRDASDSFGEHINSLYFFDKRIGGCTYPHRYQRVPQRCSAVRLNLKLCSTGFLVAKMALRNIFSTGRLLSKLVRLHKQIEATEVPFFPRPDARLASS